jgi:hypothetical protein
MSTSTAPPPMAARHATLAEVTGLLRAQHARMVDVTAPAGLISSRGGNLILDQSVPQLTSDGVTMTAGSYRPTAVFDEGIAGKLGIPAAYLRRMRDAGQTGLYDANINGWLAGDDRTFLIRCLLGNDSLGIARAFLSDQFAVIDHLDTLFAVLDGIRASGYDAQVEDCDLTDRRLYVRFRCDEVRVMAPLLLHGYRSPFTGASGADNPGISAGFVFTNSETGCGAWSLTPRLIAQVCSNGMIITRDATRVVHRGDRQEPGVTWRWSPDTDKKELALLTARVRDTATNILDPRYVERAVRAMEAQAGHTVEPVAAIQHVAARLRYTQAQEEEILAQLHRRRFRDRGRDHARRHQRRPSPARRRHRLPAREHRPAGTGTSRGSVTEHGCPVPPPDGEPGGGSPALSTGGST